jgi:hypothetical protein
MYFSQNDLSKMPPQVLATLENWQMAPETYVIRKEAELVKKWVEMASKKPEQL